MSRAFARRAVDDRFESSPRVFESKGVKGHKERARIDLLNQLACTLSFFLFIFSLGRKNFDLGSLPDVAVMLEGRLVGGA